MSLSRTPAKSPRLLSNQGAVVLLALVFMLLLSMVAATVLQSAILQLHMAGNDQFKEEALYRAQAIVAELSLEPENFSLQGDVGRTNCPPGDDSPQCHQHSLQLPTSAQALEGYALDIRVTRQDPLLWRGFPIRENEHEVSSSNRFDAAIFEVDVHVDGSEARLGSAHIVQGVAVRVPAFRQ